MNNKIQKKVLLDLSVLKHPYCGLGQIALNYVRLINSLDTTRLPFRFVLLVPRKYYGCCGDKADYVPRKRLYKFLPWLYPKVDVWHAIHQLSSFRPYSHDTRYLLTIHDFNFMYEKSKKVADQYHRRVQARINRADFITCISQFTETELHRWMTVPADTPVRVIYNGVEFASAEEMSYKPVQVSTDKPFFFSIGEIKEKKNFLAIVRMMQYMPDYHLYLAGKDNTPYAEQIRLYIKQNGICNVTLLGIVSNEERLWLYRYCAAFLFPSLFEGFGLPVIEAMAELKPVFSSPFTSLKEIGGNYAFFFNEDFEPQQMANTVKDGLCNVTKGHLKAQQKYAHSYQYNIHFNNYIKLYTQLCNG